MADLVEKVTTALSFTKDGHLVPAGTRILVDPDEASAENLADVGDAPVNRPVAVAPVGPTGPDPTMPQQVPPGAFQTNAGYATGTGDMLVAQGGSLAPLTGEERDELNTLRAHFAANQSGSAATAGGDEFAPRLGGPVGGDPITPPAPASKAFDPDAVINGTVPEVTDRLDGMTREQLIAVRAAEDDREKPRAGVTEAINARIAKLDEQAGDDI